MVEHADQIAHGEQPGLYGLPSRLARRFRLFDLRVLMHVAASAYVLEALRLSVLLWHVVLRVRKGPEHETAPSPEPLRWLPFSAIRGDSSGILSEQASDVARKLTHLGSDELAPYMPPSSGERRRWLAGVRSRVTLCFETRSSSARLQVRSSHCRARFRRRC